MFLGESASPIKSNTSLLFSYSPNTSLIISLTISSLCLGSSFGFKWILILLLLLLLNVPSLISGVFLPMNDSGYFFTILIFLVGLGGSCYSVGKSSVGNINCSKSFICFTYYDYYDYDDAVSLSINTL